MNYREKMKEYLKEPNEYSSQYGKWGILNKEQRDLIKRLLKEMDSADEVIKNQFFEIERLKDKYEQREKKWEKWTTEKTILSSKMSDYLCKYQNIKREYTKQIKISTDRKKEIERLGNELQIQIEDNTRLNEYIEAQDKQLQQKENIIKEVREYIKAEKVIKKGNMLEQITNYEKKLLEILDKENI